MFLPYGVVGLASITLSAAKPYHNWDLIGYVAAARSFEERDIARLQDYTYDQVKASVSPAEFRRLVSGSYAHAVFTDSSAFAEQLPFYQIRPVYNGLVVLLCRAGVPIVFATHIVPAVSVSIALVVLYVLAQSFVPPLFQWAVPFVAVVFGVFDLARHSTPDGLAFLTYVLLVYLYVRRRMTILYVALPLAVGVRTDLVLFALLMHGVLFATRYGPRTRTVMSAIITIAVYRMIVAYARHPGWETTFYSTFIRVLDHPLSSPPALAVTDYLHAFARGVYRAAVDARAVLYAIVVAYFVLFVAQDVRRSDASSVAEFASRRPVVVAGALSVLYALIHFVLFPEARTRFMAPPYIVGALACLSLASRVPRSSPARRGAAPTPESTARPADEGKRAPDGVYTSSGSHT